MKFLTVLLLLGLPCLPAIILAGDAAIPPPPPGDVSGAAGPDLTPTATIGFSNSASVRAHGHHGSFGVMAIHPHETANIQLSFAHELAGASLLVQALDAGEATVTKPNQKIANDGTTSFLFKAGDQPGLYRVSVTAGSSRSILQFWIADPANPVRGRPLITGGN